MTKVSSEKNSIEESSDIEQQNNVEDARENSSLTIDQGDIRSQDLEQIGRYSPRQIIV